MKELIKTSDFDRWLRQLRDKRARARVLVRLDRLKSGNPGDAQPIGEGLSELRINYGPGYRVYFMQQGPIVVILLCGGDKGSQSRDIAKAKALAAEWRNTE